jgi:hypothetical protein
MLDASLSHSFFFRDKSGKIIGMDGHMGWHSECVGESGGNGVMMINSHYNSNVDYE